MFSIKNATWSARCRPDLPEEVGQPVASAFVLRVGEGQAAVAHDEQRLIGNRAGVDGRVHRSLAADSRAYSLRRPTTLESVLPDRYLIEPPGSRDPTNVGGRVRDHNGRHRWADDRRGGSGSRGSSGTSRFDDRAATCATRSTAPIRDHFLSGAPEGTAPGFAGLVGGGCPTDLLAWRATPGKTNVPHSAPRARRLVVG